ncbi:PaaI family thioesterase [Methylobacterium sp. P1-11]|uniref:PaaI family thioesterase n=1 Tax=Methylobacterium sp. P1-11 TaxID=2024616 RepID=UPI001FEFAEB2|nr:PaaI family thioesterase [Methylobacterium sp. P1-11]
MRALIAGEVPPPPMIALLGIDIVSAEAGCVTMRMEPGEYLYNPLGSIHGGATASLLDTVMACVKGGSSGSPTKAFQQVDTAEPDA